MKGHPSTWSDWDVERLGHVIYLPEVDKIEHVRRLPGGLWAIFKSGPTTYVRCKLPDNHELA